MADTAELVRRDGVELVRTGSWELSSGRWDATPHDLAAAVAALQCPAVRKPVLWIGHTDDRFTPRGDGDPTIGWVENLRIGDGGHTLLGDYVGVPAWLDSVMASAYPGRSIEGAYNHRCQLGHTHPFVLDGVALLGVTRPGVGTLKSLNDLDDVKALYGLAASAEPTPGEVRITASIPGTVVAADGEVHSGAMVALIPIEEDAQRLAVEGGEPADQLHVTLMYLGDAAEIPSKIQARIIDAVRRSTAGIPPVEADGFYVAPFNPPGVTQADGAQRETCIVLGLSGQDVDDAHSIAASAVYDVAAETLLDLPRQHSPWIPHLTLQYTDDLDRATQLADRAGLVRFDRIRVAFAGEHVDIPLTATDMADMPMVPNVLMPVAAAASDHSLREYWVHGEGAAKIRWGESGDFNRCVRHLRKYVQDAKGLCNVYHQEALGAPPGKGHVHASEDAVPNPKPADADRIREAWNASAPNSQWITEVVDGHVIVIDETDRTFTRIPVAVGDGITFGEPEKVQPGYVTIGDTVAASVVYASREESRPGEPAPSDPQPPADPTADPELPAAEPEPNTEPKEDPVSDLSEIRSRLGLADDADEAAVFSALDALQTKANAQPDPEQVAAAAAADKEREELRKEVQVLASTVKDVTTKLAASEAEKVATVKASVFAEAIKQGKIRPADREQWEKDYDEAPAAITRVLATIAPGTAVPTSLVGETGNPEVGEDVDAEFETIMARLDGPTATKGA